MSCFLTLVLLQPVSSLTQLHPYQKHSDDVLIPCLDGPPRAIIESCCISLDHGESKFLLTLLTLHHAGLGRVSPWCQLLTQVTLHHANKSMIWFTMIIQPISVVALAPLALM
jgi:hypothetical protein